MRRFALAVLLCAGLTTANLADDTETAAPRPAEDQAAESIAEQLQEKPDDRSLMDKYMIENLLEVRSLIGTDADGAEKRLAEMKEVLESLQPETDAGKRLVGRAKAAVRHYGEQLDLARVTLDELVARLKQDPDDVKSVSMYWTKVMSEVYPMARTEPDEAEKQFLAAQELLADIKEKAQQDATREAIEGIERSYVRLERRIETGKKLLALVGADAAPLDVEAWVNGDPLTDADLKGKVVLLDFWAVWCGPCIATFPQVRDWYTKYADRGLVIIGVTSYYGYTWDDEAGRPQRATNGEEVAPEDEQDMLTKFAEHHGLNYRFAIQEGRALSEYYAQSAVPHMVVIDGTGKVRLVRVGGGEKNLNDISETLEKLIADS